jgi:D-3-phosphoglycerate dehydrogenase
LSPVCRNPATNVTPNIVLMDSETEKMGIPGLLEGYANVTKYYELPPSQFQGRLNVADAIITVFGKVSQAELSNASKLKIVAVAAAGYDSVDVQAATSKGVIVTRAGTADVECVAEHAMGLMILLSKRILVAIGEVKKGNWKFRETPQAFGNEVFGKTIGVVGFGKVGRSLTKKALGMGMHVLMFDPYVSNEDAEALGSTQVGFEEILARSDYLCLTAALTKETRHLIGAKELGSMKPNAFLVNVARGGVVDEEALRHALIDRRIAGAGLDVLESEPPKDTALQSLDNCIVTPHMAGLTTERYRDVGRVAVEEVKKVLAGNPPTTENWINADALRSRQSKSA